MAELTLDQQKAIALANARLRMQSQGFVNDGTVGPTIARGGQEMTPSQIYESLPWYQQAGQAADDIVRATANGLTFGFADKLAGYMGGEGTAAERAKSADARRRAGLAYDAAQLAGGVRTALSAGNAGLTLLGRGGTSAMTGPLGVAARTGLAATEGAGYGALDALGNDTDLTYGALIGAGFGAGGNLIGEGIQSVSKVFRSPAERAQEYVSNAASMDALTPAGAQQRLQELGPAATIADLGPNMRAQTSAIATTPGEGQLTVRNALNARGNEAGLRVTKAVDSAMGGRENVLSLADDIVTRRKAIADPLYNESRNVPVPESNVLKDLMSRPSTKKAIEQAKVNIADRGGIFDEKNLTVGMIDDVKKALDDQIGAAVREGAKERVSSLMEIKNGLVSHADEVAPQYAEARRLFSGDSSVINALEDGLKVFDNNMTPDMLSKHLAGLDESSREAYIAAARQKVANTMGTARNDAAAVRSMFNKEYNAEKLKILLGDEGAEKILQGIASEDAFQLTKNTALGGSDTVPKANAQALIASPKPNEGVIRSLLNLRPGDALASIGDKVVGGALAGRNERTNAEIAKLLMGRDPQALATIAPNNAIRDAVTRALIGGYTGTN